MTILCSTSVRCDSLLDVALADIAAAGFSDIDLLAIDGWVHINTSDLANDFAAAIAPLDALLAKHRLRPLAINSGIGPQLYDRSDEGCRRRTRELAALVKLMKHLDVGIAAIQPRQADATRPEAASFADCVTSLAEQLAVGVAAGRTFALELHVNSPFETLDQARRVIEALPELPLVYDPTHYVMQGIDIRETGWLIERAAHVHLRDAAPGQIQAPFGQGAVDFDWVLGTLRERGYNGHISIEYLETSNFDALESALRLQEAIQKYFA